jgi:branched-chain amino acid transport system substrate-binding protein
MKKFFALLSLVVILATILAACGPAAAPAAPTSAPAAATAAPAEPTTAPEPAAAACTDPKGCVEVGANDPIRIAYSFVLSGADASLGNDTKRGVEIAVDDMNGELLGHKIELAGEDSLCSAEGGQTVAQKLAADPKVVAVIGTNCSSAARAAIPIICGASIPMVSPSNTAPDLTKEDRPADYWCYLRTAHNDNVQGAAMADFAWEKGFKRAATIHDGSIYAQQLQEVFANRFKELGGEIVAQEAVAPTDTDMHPMLTRVAAAKPDFIYYPIFIAAGAQITKQAREVPGLETVQLAGADGMFSADFLKGAGDAAMGFYWSSPDFSAFGSAYQDYLAKNQEKYGEAPLAPFHAHAYDAFNMIAAAVEKVAVKNADGSLSIPRDALVKALFATKDFKGLTGNLTCTPTGDCADPKIAVYEDVSTDPASWNPGASADSNPKKIWPQ